jgi:hypothetical protein
MPYRNCYDFVVSRLCRVGVLSRLAILLVFMAIFAVVASELNHVRQRAALVARIRQDGGFAMFPVNAWRSRPEIQISAWRRLLGDHAYGDVGVVVRRPSDQAMLEEAQRLFPEATISSGEFHLGGLWIGR